MAEKTTNEELKKVRQEMNLNHKALEKCNEDLIVANKKVDKGEFEKEKTLIELNSDLEKMMFTISHKVRNSVPNILAISTLINEDDTIETDELKEMLNIIFVSEESLNKATEELSKFIRDRKVKL
jgi:light-regulated signal transduction histidine kinase (bacteriophytochrome)